MPGRTRFKTAEGRKYDAQRKAYEKAQRAWSLADLPPGSSGVALRRAVDSLLLRLWPQYQRAKTERAACARQMALAQTRSGLHAARERMLAACAEVDRLETLMAEGKLCG